jgi:hypothetical protein
MFEDTKVENRKWSFEAMLLRTEVSPVMKHPLLQI